MLLVQFTVMYTMILIFVAVGGLFSERSGVINIGLEGEMIMGALGGALVLAFLPPTTPTFITFILSILSAALVGMLTSGLLAIASITFKADQTLVGTAINMLATAGATVIVKTTNHMMTAGKEFSANLEYIQNVRCFFWTISPKFQINYFIFLTIILLCLAIFIFKKTRFGMRLMACGEHPQAADSVGINVYKMRYLGVLISGMGGGIGGLIYITASNTQWNFSYGVAGAGFLALAVMIFGQWDPIKIALASLVFGFFRAIADAYIGYDFLVNLFSGEFYKMLPYIISLIVLALTSGKSRAPKAAGIPYDKAVR